MPLSPRALASSPAASAMVCASAKYSSSPCSYLADEMPAQPRRFLVQVEPTLKTLLAREDSDNNYQITIDDKGPKVPPLGHWLAELADWDLGAVSRDLGLQCPQ